MIPISCTLCRWYSPNLTNRDGQGVCRRHPPAAYPMAQGGITIWPSVRPQDWCGEGESGISHDSVAAGKTILDKGNSDHK
jgi:hypothetical protein